MAKGKGTIRSESDALRLQAEDCLRSNNHALQDHSTGKDINSLVHELDVHQIELEMQNATLRQSRDEVESALERYTDLYDFSPAGYFTLDRKGAILATNLTGSSFLGVERSKLTGQPFALYVAAESRPVYSSFLERIFTNPGEVHCELTLTKKGNASIIAHFAALASESGQECRVAVIDITKRKKAEEALLVNENIYRAIGESIDYGIWICTPDGRNIYASQSFLDLVGITQEQCSNFGWGDILHPDDARHTIAAWKECVRTEGQWDIEHRYRGVDGQWHDILARGLPVRNERGEIIYWSGINLDISRLKKAEKALRNSEERLHLFIEYAPAALAMFDNEMRYIHASNRWLSDYGLTGSHLYGLSHYDVFPEISDQWKEFHRRALAGEVISKDEDLFLRADGSLQWLRWEIRPWYSDDGVTGGLVIFTEDITERKLTENLLKKSEKMFRDVVTASADWIWETNRDGIFTFASEKVLNVLGYTPEEIIGRTPFDLMTPDEAARVRNEFQGFVDRQAPFRDLININIHKDGSLRFILSSGVPVFDEHHALCGYRGVDKDITTRKLAEIALEKSHENLEYRIMERTNDLTRLNLQLIQEIDERKKAEVSLQTAYEEIKKFKDRLQAENIYLQQEIAGNHNFGEIIGNSKALSNVFIRVKQVAPMTATVLLLGETGTGKGMVARAIHNLSTRKARPMVTVNCTSLPATLIESELFGRERGAFTGSGERQIGRFELANGGTIFLDEIGELPLDLQSKLLRVIQDGMFERLGSPRTIKVDVRIIAATNRNLEEEIRNNRFREDLFYRLNVFPIMLPPLRQRTEDIPDLVNHFVNKFNKKTNKHIVNVSKGTLHTLEQYHWPGNVRELESIIERAVITSQGTTLQILDRLDAVPKTGYPAEADFKALVELEYDHILKALQKTMWRIEGKRGAAVLLGLNPSTLRARMRKYGLVRD